MTLKETECPKAPSSLGHTGGIKKEQEKSVSLTPVLVEALRNGSCNSSHPGIQLFGQFCDKSRICE